MMRHAGIHWPENAGGEHPNRETIAAFPGIRDGCALICSPSGRFHYDFLRQRCPTAVWRAIPRQGKRPAELGWNADRVAAECMNLWFEQPHGGTEWFQPLNEPQRADVELGGAFPGYGEWARFCSRLRESLRAIFRNQDVKLMFPALVPMDEFDHLGDWAWEAKLWDALVVHCYGSAETQRTRYDAYRVAFPGQPILIGEWNANHEGHDERAILKMWAEVAASDPLFLGATYYIWETQNAGEHDLSVYGNAAREDLFRTPPVAKEEPVPDFPIPVDDAGNEWAPSKQDIIDGALAVADEAGLPRDLMLALCLAESGEALQSFERWSYFTDEAKGYIVNRNRAGLQSVLDRIAAVGTNDISFGPCHQTWRWSPEFNGNPYDLQAILEFRKLYIQDHGHALRVARDQIARFWATYGPDKRETLARYNKPDGTASASVRARYASMLELARGMLPAEPGGVVFEDFRDPQPAGTFPAMPRGVILHGSRSGKAGNPKASEYAGTANWEVNNPNDLGWHATIGENRVAVHLTPREWGWNARGSSSHFLAVEFAQATVDEAISDAQVDAFCAWLTERALPVWPGLPLFFPTHAELDGTPEYGQKDGKSDVFPAGDGRADELRARIMARLEPAPDPEPEPAPDLATLVGVAYSESGVVIPALTTALANPDPANLRQQVEAVVKFLRENRPQTAA